MPDQTAICPATVWLRPRAMIAAAGMPTAATTKNQPITVFHGARPLRVARKSNPQVVMNCPEHTQRNANEHEESSHGNAVLTR